MNYVSPSYESAMDAPVRRLDVGGDQGRGNPPASRYHHEAAEVASIKSSTPRFPDMPITMEDDGPSLLASRAFKFGVLFNVCAWGGVALWTWLR